MTTTRQGADLAALANGTVRGRHVVVLFALVYFLGFAIAYWLSKDADPLYKLALQTSLWGATIFALFALVTLAVPELRRLFPEVISGGRAASATDLLVAIAFMVTWGLGASRILFNYSLFFLFDQDAIYRWFQLGKKQEVGPIYLLFGVITSVVVAPVVEEIIFRGYLLNLWLARHRVWFAVWGSAIFFGLWHFKYIPFAIGMGLFFALVYLKYRSLILCMLLHGLYNLLVNLLVLPETFWNKDRASVTALSSWTAELCLAILFVPMCWLFWKRFRPQSAFSS